MYNSISLKKRIISLVIVVIFAAFALVARLFYIQIVDGKNLQSKALDQWMRDLPLTAQRGDIKDRNGVTLATSYSVYDVYVKPVLVEKVESEAVIYSSVLGLDKDEVLKKITNRSVSEILISKKVAKEKIKELQNYGLSSFVATENWERDYIYGDYLSQILGFTNIDGNGQSGIELFYNQYLAGIPGVSLVESDARGSETKDSQSFYIPAIEGLDVHLTIDFQIQAEVEKLLTSAWLTTGAKSATALVMDPKTGEIIAASTKPSVNLNELDRNDLENLFALTRAFSFNDSYEPGSTFKAITAAIGLDLGVTSPGHGYYCPGYRIVDGVRINCWKKTGHGAQTLTQGLANSCNCVFMQVMYDIGYDNFFKYVDKLHLGSLLGIDFPSEGSGIVISKETMTNNDFLRNGFGQSIATTPLQLLSAISAAITDGYVKQPYLVKSITTNDGKSVYENNPTRINKAFSPNIASVLNEMLEKVIQSPGGKPSAVDGYAIAGKSGTAQKYDDDGKASKGKYIASFFSYYPASDPDFIVLVLIDEPSSSIYGNIVSAPCVADILRKIFEIRGIKPDSEQVSGDDRESFEMPDLIGKSLTEASSILAGLELYCMTEGEGNKVMYQTPPGGTFVKKGDTVLLKF